MEIDPFSMLEVSLQEGPDESARNMAAGRSQPSAGVMHAVENDDPVVQLPPPPFLNCYGSDSMAPQRAVLNNIQKLSSTTKDEERFRKRAYSSITLVLRKRLHCTICDAHIGAYIGLKEKDIEHPLLKVLACTKCTLMYHYIEFPLNLDGRDVRCRWCTQSGNGESPLRYCTYCPFAFCEMCIYRNLPLDELASKTNWMCFVCNGKDLWPSRAILWALRVLIDTNLYLKEEKKWSTDQSTCCKNRDVKAKRQMTRPGPPALLPAPLTNGTKVPVKPVLSTPAPALQRPVPPRPVQTRPPASNFQHHQNMKPGVIKLPRSQPQAVPSANQPQANRIIKPNRSQLVRPNQPQSGSSLSNTLYDTGWLTGKVNDVKVTISNLDNNLRRLTQGIPAKENRYNIKSKMITLVSLLNISASHLQKVSKEMEEESRRILDNKGRIKSVSVEVLSPTVNFNPQPSTSSRSNVSPAFRSIVPPALPSTSGLKRPSSRFRTNRSRYRNKRRRTDSDSDPDDPDFKSKAQVDTFETDDAIGVDSPSSEDDQTLPEELMKKKCFVKLERLDEKIVECLEEDEDHRPQSTVSPESTDASKPTEQIQVGSRDSELENGEVSHGETGGVSSSETGRTAVPKGDFPDSSGESPDQVNSTDLSTTDKQVNGIAENHVDKPVVEADTSEIDCNNEVAATALNTESNLITDSNSVSESVECSQSRNDDVRPMEEADSSSAENINADPDSFKLNDGSPSESFYPENDASPSSVDVLEYSGTGNRPSSAHSAFGNSVAMDNDLPVGNSEALADSAVSNSGNLAVNDSVSVPISRLADEPAVHTSNVSAENESIPSNSKVSAATAEDSAPDTDGVADSSSSSSSSDSSSSSSSSENSDSSSE